MKKYLTDATGAPANDKTVSLILTELSEGIEYANCDKIQAQYLLKFPAEYREFYKEPVFWEKETRKLFTRWTDKQTMGERVQATPMEGTEKEDKVPEEAPKSPTKTKKRVRFADPVPETRQNHRLR